MGIDIKKLIRGERVVCDTCNKGVLVPQFGSSAAKASQFICTECGEKLILCKRRPAFMSTTENE